MPKKLDEFHLYRFYDILSMANFISSQTMETWDTKTYYAVLLNIETMGEASHLCDKTVMLDYQMPQKLLAEIRGRLIHRVFRVQTENMKGLIKETVEDFTVLGNYVREVLDKQNSLSSGEQELEFPTPPGPFKSLMELKREVLDTKSVAKSPTERLEDMLAQEEILKQMVEEYQEGDDKTLYAIETVMIFIGDHCGNLQGTRMADQFPRDIDLKHWKNIRNTYIHKYGNVSPEGVIGQSKLALRELFPPLREVHQTLEKRFQARMMSTKGENETEKGKGKEAETGDTTAISSSVDSSKKRTILEQSNEKDIEKSSDQEGASTSERAAKKHKTGDQVNKQEEQQTKQKFGFR